MLMLRKALLALALSGGLLAGCGGLASEVSSPTAPGPEQSGTPVVPGLPPTWTHTPGGPPTATGARPTALTSQAATPTRARPTPTLPSRPSPTPAPGWSEVVVAGDSYALRLPPNWLPLPLEGQSPPAVLDQIGQDDPVLALSLRQGLPQGVLDTLSLMAFDSLAAAGDAPFVSAIRVGPAPFLDYDAAADYQAEALSADPQATLLSDLPISVGFEARRGRALRYTTLFPPDAPQVTAYHTQVYVDNGHGKVLVITFSTQGDREGYERLFELVLDTLHFSLSEAG